jgi:hypothetical protein
MCKLLIAATAALLSAVPLSASAQSAFELTTPAAVTTPRGNPIARGEPGTTWVALAVSTNGRVFQSNPANSEELARSLARNECERTVGRSCGDTMSVPDNWDVIVLRCGTQNFLGGSGQGAAYDIALGKATDGGFSAGRCRQIANY